VLSYVVWTHVRSYVHKQITKRRYGEEKPRPFVFGKLVFFALGLGLATPYSLGILVWSCYQTFAILSIAIWLRFEPEIRPTRFEIIFFFITARAERKVHLCLKLIGFFSQANTHPFDLKFVAFSPKFSQDSYVKFQEKTTSGEFF